MSTQKLIHGSCLDPKKGVLALPDKSIDLVLTDPPYEEECHDGNSMMRFSGDGKRNAGAKKVKLSFGAMTEAEREIAAQQIVRVCRGWALIFCQDEGVIPWRNALVRHGAKKRRTCIWHKTDAMPKILGDAPGQGHEVFIAVWCGEGQSKWNGGGRSSVFSYAGGPNKWHETEKPIDLITALLFYFSNEGAKVADLYAGSGTTHVACRRTGRDCIGWETDEKYVKNYSARLKLESGVQLTLAQQGAVAGKAKRKPPKSYKKGRGILDE